MTRNLTQPLILNGRWYSRVRIWSEIQDGRFAAAPPHYTSAKRFWIVFADQIAVKPTLSDTP